LESPWACKALCSTIVLIVELKGELLGLRHRTPGPCVWPLF
jgi:hypothetical protein